MYPVDRILLHNIEEEYCTNPVFVCHEFEALALCIMEKYDLQMPCTFTEALHLYFVLVNVIPNEFIY